MVSPHTMAIEESTSEVSFEIDVNGNEHNLEGFGFKEKTESLKKKSPKKKIQL